MSGGRPTIKPKVEFNWSNAGWHFSHQTYTSIIQCASTLVVLNEFATSFQTTKGRNLDRPREDQSNSLESYSEYRWVE